MGNGLLCSFVMARFERDGLNFVRYLVVTSSREAEGSDIDDRWVENQSVLAIGSLWLNPFK